MLMFMYWLRNVWKASFDSSKSRMSSPISIPCPNFLMLAWVVDWSGVTICGRPELAYR